MQYIDNWDKIKQRTLEFWERENHDRPLMYVTAPNGKVSRIQVKEPDNITDTWLDTEYQIKNNRRTYETTYYGAEAFPMFNPNLGPDILGAAMGCDLEFGKTTSWARHFVEDWKSIGKLKFDPENKWWKEICRITESAVEDSQGDYYVETTDLHAGLDALVSLRGPENLATDIYDDPDSVKNRTFEVFDVFKKVFDGLCGITVRYLPGTTNWMKIWHPGKWYVTSCDFICMISEEMFTEFVLPELTAELKWLDASIFHLDGPGALRHLDALLDIHELKGIQWVPGASRPGPAHWIDVLKKIQDAGKIIHIGISPEEIDTVLENLRPEGLFLGIRCKTEQDAKDIIKKAENAYKFH